KVTDAGIEELGGLNRLRDLSLQDTGISDAALVHLRGLRQLKTLNVGLTQISDVVACPPKIGPVEMGVSG
ncbi:MAG: hypothetical protein ACLQVF_04010, partial [Isosphaeraceae bacterium]